MGLGETQMRNWGFVAASSAIAVSIFLFVLSILTIVVIRGSVSVTVRDDAVSLSIVTIILSIAAAILSIFSIVKIYKANDLYLRVNSDAPPAPPTPGDASAKDTDLVSFESVLG